VLKDTVFTVFLSDLSFIARTLWNGHLVAKHNQRVMRGDLWPLYKITSSDGDAVTYKRLCPQCCEHDIKLNKDYFEFMASDRGKRRHVEKCDRCGKAAPMKNASK